MYEKNLTEDLRLRLSSKDMDFLRELSTSRSMTISECIRGIIGEYRRSLETMELFTQTVKLINDGKLDKLTKGAELSNGDTETDFNNKL